jgi:hypothetical protein
VKIIVGTSGSCEGFSVNFGDGSSPATVDLGSLPTGKILTHVYAKTGKPTVTVKGVGECTGSATAKVTVKAGNPSDLSLNQLLNEIYVDPQFGNKSIRGFIIKEINGQVLAGMNTGLSFQPLSTLKLLPYLYTMVEIDKGNATLATNLTWIEATTNDPATPFDETKLGSCYAAGAPGTKQNSAAYSVVLPTMMWFSHNRTLDAFLAKYGPANVTSRGQQLGLASTQMFSGCPQGADMKPWSKNRSTLLDLAKIYEGVDNKTFLTQDATRQAFYANMINITNSGSSYTSPILGGIGPLTLKGIYGLDKIVQREASKLGLPDSVVDQFLQQVIVRGKGGSGGPSDDEIGFSDFLHVTLPFKGFQSPVAELRAKKNGPNNGPPLPKVIVPKSFSIGWFIYNLKKPAGCPDPGAAGAVKATCDAIWHPDRLATFKSEIFAPAIRQALATW